MQQLPRVPFLRNKTVHIVHHGFLGPHSHLKPAGFQHDTVCSLGLGVLSSRNPTCLPLCCCSVWLNRSCWWSMSCSGLRILDRVEKTEGVCAVRMWSEKIKWFKSQQQCSFHSMHMRYKHTFLMSSFKHLSKLIFHGGVTGQWMFTREKKMESNFWSQKCRYNHLIGRELHIKTPLKFFLPPRGRWVWWIGWSDLCVRAHLPLIRARSHAVSKKTVESWQKLDLHHYCSLTLISVHLAHLQATWQTFASPVRGLAQTEQKVPQ